MINGNQFDQFPPFRGRIGGSGTGGGGGGGGGKIKIG